MSTKCPPLLADLFEKKLARSFNFTFCFIDNVLSLNNYRFGDFVELEVRNTTDTDRSVSYLDIHIEIDSERRLRTKLYDTRIFPL